MKRKFKIITLNELRELLKSDEDFVLVNPLNKENFEEGYIPKSMHISIHADDFEEKVRKIIPNKNRKIIVYCRNSKCETSDKAYKKLTELGYSNVCKYAGGTEEWKENGFPLISIKTN